jgi:hypothetical protein
LTAATVGAAGWSLRGLDGDVTVVPPAERTMSLNEPATERSDSTFDNAVAARALRRPLFDPPPPPPAPTPEPKPQPEPKPTVARTPTPPKPPTLEVTLVGTIIEAGQSLAIVADANGDFDVKGIGEPLELSPQGIKIEKIEPEQVTVSYQGRESTITLDRSAAADRPARSRAGGRRRTKP